MGKKERKSQVAEKARSKTKPPAPRRVAVPSRFPANLLEDTNQKNYEYSRPKPRLETLLPGYVWVIRDFFTSNECQAWVKFMDNEVTMELCKHKATRLITNRECLRYQRNDATMAHRIFERLFTPPYEGTDPIVSAALPNFRGEEAATCNPNIRLYKYTKGMSFGRHVDESSPVDGVGYTRLTMLVYLTSCKGGATSFEHDVSFSPMPGALLLHVHGDDCLLHEGKAVTAGEKYILRTDLVYSMKK